MKFACPRNVTLHVKRRKNNPKIQQSGTENPKFDNKCMCSRPHMVDFHDSRLENCPMCSQKQSLKMACCGNVAFHVKRRKIDPKITQWCTEHPKFDNKSMCSRPHKVDFHDSSVENCAISGQKQVMKIACLRNVTLHVKWRQNNPKLNSVAQRTQKLTTIPCVATHTRWISMIQVLKTVQQAVQNNP